MINIYYKCIYHKVKLKYKTYIFSFIVFIGEIMNNIYSYSFFQNLFI